MSEGIPYLDIILLAMIAGFIFLRLFNVLGRRTGNERRPAEPFSPDEDAAGGENIVKLPGVEDEPDAESETASQIKVDPDSDLGRRLSAIVRADGGFDPVTFIGGAKTAYKMIVEAFGDGDRDVLRGLLNEEVFEQFCGAIDGREDARQTADTRVLDIVSADIEDANLVDKTAEISVRFESEILSVIKDSEGRIIEGNPSDAETVTDVWTFARSVKSRDPAWLLIESQSED